MYRSCIFCSGKLGSNDAIEGFPVGRTVAFDAGKGRLWAVCPTCGRWNLAPLEERWEVVEEAERLFRDCRLRAQSENVGLAKLRDGTRLVRVGAALQGELAAWRYGSQLVRRRWRYLVTGTAVLGGTGAAWAGSVLLPVGGSLAVIAIQMLNSWANPGQNRPIARFEASESPTGTVVTLLPWRVAELRLGMADDGALVVRVPDPHLVERPGVFGTPYRLWREAEFRGEQARTLLSRAMVVANRRGASRTLLGHGIQALQSAGTAEDFLRRHAQQGSTLGKRRGLSDRRMSQPEVLALEMALHEEQERRALEGELAELEAAWRQAEEIAAIADRLPDLPAPEPPRL